MRHTHHAQQWLPYTVATVFDFFADPGNLPKLMPAWQEARIDESLIAATPSRPVAGDCMVAPSSSAGPVASPVAGKGSKLTISFRPVPFVPFRLHWDAEITEFAWDSHFCDVQLRRGPFTYWRHCHRLEARPRDGRPGTLLRDQVDYEVPLGPLGDLANSIFVARQMDYIFSYRQKRTEALLGAMRTSSPSV